MKCEECEKGIYLYRESSEEERLKMRNHMENCEECTKLFKEVQAASYLIESARSKGEPANSAALTSRIIDNLPANEPRESVLNYFLGLLDLSAVRYSMAVASVFLLVFFVTEFFQPGHPLANHVEMQHVEAGVVLRSDDLRQEFVSRSQRKSLVGDCTTTLREIDIDCIKEKIKKLSF
jgi:hypothetical protein